MLQVLNLNTKNNANIHNEIKELDQLIRFTSFNQQQSFSRSSPKEISSTKDAINLLTADHQYLTDLFLAYENLANASQENSVEKAHLVAEICSELLIHSQVEETVFYPAAEKALINYHHSMEEPIIEYAGLVALIADVEQDQQRGKNSEAKIKVLSEYWKHHVKQEQDLFPKLRATGIDLEALGRVIAGEKQAIIVKRRALISEKMLNFKGLN